MLASLLHKHTLSKSSHFSEKIQMHTHAHTHMHTHTNKQTNTKKLQNMASNKFQQVFYKIYPLNYNVYCMNIHCKFVQSQLTNFTSLPSVWRWADTEPIAAMSTMQTLWDTYNTPLKGTRNVRIHITPAPHAVRQNLHDLSKQVAP